MRALITGLEGFTGYYVKHELEAHGYEVIALKSNLTDKISVATEIRQLKPEAIVHLAAVTFVDHDNADDFYQVNARGTQNLLEAIYRFVPNIRGILLASSANVYGNQMNKKFDENAQPNPMNDYAVSKFEMEKMASLWFDRLPIFIVRPFNYTGVGQSDNFLIPKIVRHFQERSSLIKLGNLDVYREFNDVRMIAEIYRKLISILPVGEIINICTGKSYSLKEIIMHCEAATGHHIDIRVDPKFVRENEVKNLVGINAKLKNLIVDWKECNLDDTLTWMLESSVINKL